jgi:hypothetical protein
MAENIDSLSLVLPNDGDYLALCFSPFAGCKFDLAHVFIIFNGLSIIAPGGGCQL